MAMTYPEKFGEAVRAVRDSRGLSQDALAAAAGLHRTHISLIERGQRSVRLETVVALATALGVQPADLMPPVPRTAAEAPLKGSAGSAHRRAANPRQRVKKR
jgi:transcriptional regulator with XRE-family HTH domain